MSNGPTEIGAEAASSCSAAAGGHNSIVAAPAAAAPRRSDLPSGKFRVLSLWR
jgi:hypothetical protein